MLEISDHFTISRTTAFTIVKPLLKKEYLQKVGTGPYRRLEIIDENGKPLQQQFRPLTGTIHHITLYVSNLTKSRDFWHWLLVERLGYTVYQEWDSGISFRFGETYLDFVQTETRNLDVPYHRCRPGLNHIAFHCATKEIVDSIVSNLELRGVKLLYPDRHPYAGGEGYYAAFFEDPDRFKVELVADEI